MTEQPNQVERPARSPAPRDAGSPVFINRGDRGSPQSLADVLERVLDKGIVIVGDIQVRLLDIELLTIKVRLMIASVDRAREMGINWWEGDPFVSTTAGDQAGDLPQPLENGRPSQSLERGQQKSAEEPPRWSSVESSDARRGEQETQDG